MKTTKGIPDTYFLDSNNKYIFVMYTTQQTKIYEKIYEDICDCLNIEKTGLPIKDIVEIIYCHTSSNLSVGKNKELYDLCSSNDILFRLHGIDEIASNMYTRFHGISRDFLNISISTDQIFEVEDFISFYDSNGMAAPLSTTFQLREKEKNEIMSKIKKSPVTVITGPAGVGKTRLALECCRIYAMQNDYRLFCIQSNHLPIYEDLKVYLDTPQKYLLLIDDANQLTALQHILQYLLKDKQGYNVKIVITVRDYAKASVIQNILGFVKPEIYTISIFSDEEIKTLLESNLQILNSNYLNKIIGIAEGNARLAIIAGKLAIEKQSMASINDATQLYEGYYDKFIQNSSLHQSRDLYAVAGIIAFLTAIDLKNSENLTLILDELNISHSLFIEYTYQLHNLELVDIYNDKVVKISDQCLGNYLLSYVFMTKRIIPLSTMLKVCFKGYKSRVVHAVNTLANIFASQNMHQKIEKEVSIVWDYFKNSEKSLFFEFVKVFYRIKPTETLIIINEKINTLPQGILDINAINFEKGKRDTSVNDDILRILGGLSETNDLSLVLDLLFTYYKKTPQNFMDFYHTIINSFGITKDSYSYNYLVQNQLITKFIEYAEEWSDKDVSILFIKVAAQFLKLYFSPSEAGRGHTIIMYQIPVEISNGSKKYRELIWNSLFDLYSINNSNQLEVQKIIEEYGQFSLNKIEQEMVQFDSTFVIRFFDELFSPNVLLHCIIAKAVVDQFERITLDLKPYLLKYLNNNNFLIYKTLKGEHHYQEFDWEKEQKIKKTDIQDLLSDCSEEKIFKIIQVCSIYEGCDRQNTWGVKEGLGYVFTQLESNKDLFLYAVNTYLSHNAPINLFPDNIVNKMFELLNAEEVYSIINGHKFDYKNTWEFSFFKNIPLEYISEKTVQQLYGFLLKPEKNISSSPYREIEFLNKYKKFDNEVFVKASYMILNNYEYSSFIFFLYFSSIFHSYNQVVSPKVLLNWFENDFELLKEIYFKIISYDKDKDKDMDKDGRFLLFLINNEISFIDEFIKLTSKEEKFWDSKAKRLRVIWSCNNYMQCADHIFDSYYHNDDIYTWQITSYLKSFLSLNSNIETIIIRQDEWISNFISTNFNNEEWMEIIFETISEAEFSSQRRKKHILHFINLNKNWEVFNKIRLESRSYGGFGSMIPYIEEKISFLESLLPSFNGLTYLRHRQRVEQLIEVWRRHIEQEQIDEVLNDM